MLVTGHPALRAPSTDRPGLPTTVVWGHLVVVACSPLRASALTTGSGEAGIRWSWPGLVPNRQEGSSARITLGPFVVDAPRHHALHVVYGNWTNVQFNGRSPAEHLRRHVSVILDTL